MRKIFFTIVVSLFVIAAQMWADATQPLNFTAVNGPATISLDSIGTPYTVSLQYSTDNCTTWNNYPIGQEVQLASGETVFFKATTTNSYFSKVRDKSHYRSRPVNYTDYYRFNMSGSISADGDLMSLLDATMQQNAVPDSAFEALFFNCGSLISAPSISANRLGKSCYAHMFEDCTSLVSVPTLPATDLAEECYAYMFKECTTLSTAPALPAITLASGCYCLMFYGCTSLTSAPALPATTLAEECYNFMFWKCSSLIEAPQLPATNLVKYCYYYMFAECSSIIVAPQLPATNLAEYCYSHMFYGCTSLTVAPALNATTLAKYCYCEMFADCASLISIPILPATYLSEGCYALMFEGCRSLIVNTTAPGKEWLIPANAVEEEEGTSCSQMFSVTGGTFTGNPEPGVTYYIASDTTTTAVEQVTDDVNITLFPNPIHIGEPAYINTTDDIQTVEIYNPDGKCVQSITPTTSPIRIDDLNAAGIYIIRLTTKNNTSTTRKLIVQ